MARMRTAAAVGLWRQAANGPEVYLVERNPKLRFFGGYWAFPGGVLEATDDTDGDPREALRRCAVRELEEEVTVSLATERLEELCSITTPEFAPVRYDTQFYWTQLADREPRVVPGELVDGRFFTPGEALEAWRRGEMLIVPPVLFLLELFERGEDNFVETASAAAAELEAGKLHPIRFTPGIFVAPLRTATRPPATTTNCFLVGQEKVYVVDPASSDPGDLERLFAKIDEEVARGAQLQAVLLTHHHPDHIGGVVQVCERYGIPWQAHAETRTRLPESLAANPSHVGEDIVDGQAFPLGTAPDGSPDWQLQAYHTPGHAVGHLAFRESRYDAWIAADLVSTISTIVIDPPEGHLATYLKSLERLRNETVGTIYPSHGPPQRNGPGVLDYYLSHRQEREDMLWNALADGPRTESELVPVVYADTHPKAHAIAARSLLAGLIKLAEEGKVAEADGRWARVDS